MMLSGEPITAADALHIGLVNAVVSSAELLNFSRAWLQKVIANAPVALGLVMESVDALSAKAKCEEVLSPTEALAYIRKIVDLLHTQQPFLN